MDKFVARLNIGHLRKQIAEEKDDAKRKILLQILATEESNLARLLDEARKDEKR